MEITNENNQNSIDPELLECIEKAKEMGASDIHFAPGASAIMRIDGKLKPLSDRRFMPPEIDRMAASLLDEDHRKNIERDGDTDLAYSIPGFGRLRINIYKQRGTLSLAIRILSFGIPTCEELRLPQTVRDMTEKLRGLVLVTGATGCGKSTTLAALIGRINSTSEKHIITLEDPIEYLHRHDKSMVTQREIGLDSISYASALRAALREDPDVIQVGEMRDIETVSTVLSAAETGHLVFSTLHTNDAASAIDRVIDIFPPHQMQQARVQLADVLEGIVSQRLLPLADGSGRMAVFEVMTVTPAVRNLIREGKTFQIATVMQTGSRDGMMLMDDAIIQAFKDGLITEETALGAAVDAVRMMNRLGLSQSDKTRKGILG